MWVIDSTPVECGRSRETAKRSDLAGLRPGQTLTGDKNYYGRDFEATLAEAGAQLPRPARKGEPERAGAHLFKPLRQVIESNNETFKASSTSNGRGGHTQPGSLSASCGASSP